MLWREDLLILCKATDRNPLSPREAFRMLHFRVVLKLQRILPSRSPPPPPPGKKKKNSTSTRNRQTETVPARSRIEILKRCFPPSSHAPITTMKPSPLVPFPPPLTTEKRSKQTNTPCKHYQAVGVDTWESAGTGAKGGSGAVQEDESAAVFAALSSATIISSSRMRRFSISFSLLSIWLSAMWKSVPWGAAIQAELSLALSPPAVRAGLDALETELRR